MRSAIVQALLETIRRQLQEVLGEKLLGFYLYGSLVWGDFDEEISDIDSAALLRTPLNDYELEKLKEMHRRIAIQFPDWGDRIEVQYVDVNGLQDFRTVPFQMGNISPGEPLHFIPSNKNWLMNWYFIRGYGETLYGPAPETVFPAISKEEFQASVLDQVREWKEYINGTADSRPYQGYAILTMCRSLYTLRTGRQTSKRKAMEWVKENEPAYAKMVQTAWQWRTQYRDEANAAETFPMVKKFVLQMIADMLMEFAPSSDGA